MKVNCLYDRLVPINDLKPNPKNSNKHPPEQIERLAEILKYQGFRYPIKVSKQSGFITSGHGRLLAAQLNGWTEVPVNFQNYESEDQELADIVADNSIASWAELDLSMINNQLQDFSPDFNLDFLGLKDFVIDPDFSPGTEDDQGQLDQKQLVFMECPHCEKRFKKGQARVLKD